MTWGSPASTTAAHVVKAIDNLEEGAWEHEAVRDTLEAPHELKERDFIRPGTAGLPHIEPQADWLEHGAVLLPCGPWLESEMRSQIPDDFEMTVAPTPSLTDEDASPAARGRAVRPRRDIHRAHQGEQPGGVGWSCCASCSTNRARSCSRR